MARIPVEVALALQVDQEHISSSTVRIARSVESYNQARGRIRASIALIERAGFTWPTNDGPLNDRPARREVASTCW